MKNVFYYQNILRLGGTTTFVYELIKKYHNTKDITLYYNTGDTEQIKKLKKLCRVVQWNGEDEVECDVFLTNYDFNDKVLTKFKAKKYYQVIHAMYITNKVQPRLDKRFEKYICVSEIVRKEFQELTNLPNDKLLVSYNPLQIAKNEAKPRLLIGFFTRLSWEKGLEHIKSLIKALDKEKVNYLCFIYTNDACDIKSDNVFIHKALANDVRSIMATMDIVGQLSKCEGDNYTIKEAKKCNKDMKVLVTPLDCFYENNVIGQDDLVLQHDESNLNEIVNKIKALAEAKQSKLNDWLPPKDIYNDILEDGISDYEEEIEMKVTFMVDIERGCTFKELDGAFISKGKTVEIDEQTALRGVKLGYGHIVEKPLEAKIDTIQDINNESKDVKPKPKKATKKTK